jgi:hypothetical protein
VGRKSRYANGNVRRSVSPVKLSGWRPTSWVEKAAAQNIDLSRSYSRMNNLSNIGIVSELNGKFVANQDKDIEIERLQTTCYSLNNKASVAEDQALEIENLKRRLKEAEAIRAQQQR